MKQYSYQELAEAINEYFKDFKDAQVTARTLKYWVEEGILPAPRGSGRWLSFDDFDLKEVISLRKLQIYQSQSIEDIHNIIFMVKLYSEMNKFPEPGYYLSKFLSAVLSSPKHDYPIEEIEAFKKGELYLVYDEDYSPPYRLIHEDGLERSYKKENGKVYRVLLSIKDENGKVIYFKTEQIEEYLKDVESLRGNLDVTKVAEELRRLIKEGIMTSPHYRYKGKDYLSGLNIHHAQSLISLIKSYNLSFNELRQLRKRIEHDIETYFYLPEGFAFLFEPIYYEFEKQVTLFDTCLNSFHFELFWLEDSVKGHTKEDSIKIIKDYLNGFYFFCKSGFGDNVCLKKTPTDKLSAKQLKIGMSQGRFTEKEVESLIKTKESELKALKSVLKKP